MRWIALISISILTVQFGKAQDTLHLNQFGPDFLWGTACASYQIEGAWDTDGKGPSIWDSFSQKKGNIYNNENGNVATDFYHRYGEDIRLARSMNFKVFRFSISWSRIFPNSMDSLNAAGVQFYHNVIDSCLANGLEPWITLYHWDLPQYLENIGGWTNREILQWFSKYVDFCTKEYGSKVKHWMVMNEPAAFTGLGYMIGYHAPGKKGIDKFLKATHHACLAMADGGRIIRKNVKNSFIGSTFSCSTVHPLRDSSKDTLAVQIMNAVLNRLHLEPCLGLGYPIETIPALKRIYKFFEEGDDERLQFDFDFIGLQNYFRVVVKNHFFPPFLKSKQIDAKKRDVQINEMGFEIYPEGIYEMIQQFASYEKIKSIIITENGVCVKDSLDRGQVHDNSRIEFFQDYLTQVLRAKNEGAPVDGYFVWSLTDNFEWSEGYEPRFGLIYIDYKNLNRYIKDSGLWFKKELDPN